MVYRIVVGNTDKERLAHILRDWGLDGTAVDAVGFTTEWGIENAAMAIVAGRYGSRVISHAAAYAMGCRGEEAVYVDNGREAWLVETGGHTTKLT